MAVKDITIRRFGPDFKTRTELEPRSEDYSFTAEIQLNAASEYEGGESYVSKTIGVFDEKNSVGWKLDVGEAIMYAKPAMHKVKPVTKGIRYETLLVATTT